MAMRKMENTHMFGRKTLTVALYHNHGLSWGAGVGFFMYLDRNFIFPKALYEF